MADTKAYLNPKGTPRWSGSQFKFMNNISEHRFFKITASATGRLQIQTKQTCDQLDWSDPWFPMKEIDAIPDLPAAHPPNAIREVAPAVQEMVEANLQIVMARVPTAAQREELHYELDLVLFSCFAHAPY